MKTKIRGRVLRFGDIEQINALKEMNKLHDEMMEMCKEVCDINNYNDCIRTKKNGVIICKDYATFLAGIRKIQKKR